MDGMTHLGMSALINIVISLISIIICWRVLLNIHIEAILKIKKSTHVKAIIVLLSIVLGHNLASFLIDYFNWSSMIGHLIH